MAESLTKRLALRAQEIGRSEGLFRLPVAEELEKQSEAERHAAQEDLRIELFAVSSNLADAVLRRARRERPKFPPYGLVLSRHTQFRMVVANPGPVAAGAVDSFHALGRAYVDTTVFHLHGTFADLKSGGQGWLVKRLDALLSLFRVGAGPATRSRMRDPVSFIYGGLQFGTGVCVQLAEVMSAMLAEDPSLSAADRAAVMARSSLPAYDVAGFSVTEVLRVYQRLQSPTKRTTVGGSDQSWMDPSRFVVREADGRPWRIDLREDDLLPTDAQSPPEAEGLHTFTTLGCPARVSPTASASPIAALWSWCVELSHDTGLLGPTDGPGARADEALG